MILPPKNYMSLEVFQNYGRFRRKQRTISCVEHILRTFCAIKSQCVQNFDTKDKSCQQTVSIICKWIELLQLDEFQLCNILLGNDTEAENAVNILSVNGAFLLDCRL